MTEGPSTRLRLVIRTPHGAVFDESVSSLRVPTLTGQVGLRPRGEPGVLAVEAGLLLLRRDGRNLYAATAGGLIQHDPSKCVVYSPFAVVSESPGPILRALEQALSVPDSELDARRRLEELERSVLHELRKRGQPAPPPGEFRG